MSTPEIVIAILNRTDLSGALTALHRGGYGHVSRVLDPDRSDIAGQLRRAGAEVPLGFSVISDNEVAVMVSAPARTHVAADLLNRNGAKTIWQVERTGTASAFVFGPPTRRVRSRHNSHAEPVAD